ncbi:MAG: sigma-70 family RNA polymerase sigma factor [Egibacteraceae bacterium]
MALALVGTAEPVEIEDAEFAEAFRDLHPDAVRLARLLCGDAGQAEDAVSEAFACIYTPWREGRVQDLRAYLRRAVVNQVHTRGRRGLLERRVADRRWGDGRGPLLYEDQCADRDELRRLLEGLSAQQRRVLILRFYADLSVEETARALHCPTGTVKSLTARGLARLRALHAPRAA